MMIIPRRKVTKDKKKIEEGLMKKYCVVKGGIIMELKGIDRVDACILGVEWVKKLLCVVALNGMM